MPALKDTTAKRYCYACGELLPPEDRRIIFLDDSNDDETLVAAVHLDDDCAQRAGDGPSPQWLADQP